MIKAGAVQLANYGYIILNMRDVLMNPRMGRIEKGHQDKGGPR
jgi:hypothetical protein